jgi:hypothetical protein
MFVPYLASEESETIDAIVRNEQPAFDGKFKSIVVSVAHFIPVALSNEWKQSGKGLMASK